MERKWWLHNERDWCGVDRIIKETIANWFNKPGNRDSWIPNSATWKRKPDNQE